MNAKQARELTDKAVEEVGVQSFLEIIYAKIKAGAKVGLAKSVVLFENYNTPLEEQLKIIHLTLVNDGYQVDSEVLTKGPFKEVSLPETVRIFISW